MLRSRWWYAVAAAFAVLGLGIAVAIGAGVVGTAKDAKIHHVRSDGTITVGDQRVAIYADRSTPDGLSGARSATCTARPRSGGKAIVFSNPSAHVRLNDWDRIALSPRHTAAGSYTLRCEGGDGAVTTAGLGYGNNPRVASILVRTLLAVGFGLGGVVVALVIAIITVIRQHLAKTRSGPDTPSP